jgi:arylsulfatase A-like enzyme
MTRSIAAIRGDYKLIKYLDWDRYELYDLKNDPEEQINLIASKPEVLSSLKDEIDRTLVR